MGVPHRGHIDFMCRLMELGYKLVVSIQESYKVDADDPLPKWIVMKMVARSLAMKGCDLNRVRFFLTPYFDTDEQHRFHFALMVGPDELSAVASSNIAVHRLLGGLLPPLNQKTVFGVEKEYFHPRSWGAILRNAIRQDDIRTFSHFIAEGAEVIWPYEEIRAAVLQASANPVEHVWGASDHGQVFVVVDDTSTKATRFRRKVSAYSTPEDTILTMFPGMSYIDRYARETILEQPVSGTIGEKQRWRLTYLGQEKDEKANLLISYKISPDLTVSDT